jgi:hypothetical protein
MITLIRAIWIQANPRNHLLLAVQAARSDLFSHLREVELVICVHTNIEHDQK